MAKMLLAGNSSSSVDQSTRPVGGGGQYWRCKASLFFSVGLGGVRFLVADVDRDGSTSTHLFCSSSNTNLFARSAASESFCLYRAAQIKRHHALYIFVIVTNE